MVSRRSVIVVDNFYSNPGEVREQALRDGVTKIKEPFFPTNNLKSRFSKLIGKSIGEWSVSSEDGNGSFDLSYSGFREIVSDIYYDGNSQKGYVGLVFLSPNAPIEGGISFWRHRTGLLSRPVRADAERLETSVGDLSDILVSDSGNKNAWEEVDRIGNLYNRLVLFDDSLFNSATKVFGCGPDEGRLAHYFEFGTK